ncbi:hypothetical protein C0389_03700 [bacterium]|nr:hypothetical protein [bacterium]
MHGKRFHFSAVFTKKLVELTEGQVPSALFEKVLTLLEADTSKFYFTLSSESNLIRIFSSIYDPVFFFQEISKFPHHGEILVAISASSNYLTDIIVHNPEYLYQIFDQEYLSGKLDYAFIRNEVDGADKFRSFQARLNFLRQLKKRIILKIGLSDILEMDELISITQQLSFLAKSINAKLFEICYSETLNKYNVQTLSAKYCMCSLGKLGGNELNYSSDVDLILFYDFNDIVAGTNKEYHEILSEAANLFIKSSTAITDRGYIYRVDFRLRPDGKYSPLCKTVGDYIKYYETRGESWERQMLIKMDYLSGDETLFGQFSRFVQPYVYTSSFSFSVKDNIRQMKLNIEHQYSEKENVKTFSGGIRDIEFSIQALQLINGGKIKTLRTGNTLKAISALTEIKLLKKKESDTLTEAYIFYRRIEHFLQLMNDRQTHIIPSDKELLNKLAGFLKMKSADEFRSRLKEQRLKVRVIYESILSSEKYASENIFSKELFKDSQQAERNFAYLRSGIGLVGRKEFDTRTIELFGLLEPVLVKQLKKSPSPDRTLDNLVKVIRSTKFPSMWFNEFTNEKFFKNFLDLCTFSQKAIDIISSGGYYEEFFFSRKVFIEEPETMLEYSTTEMILSLSVQFALRLISEKRLSETLSLFISNKIRYLLGDNKYSYKFFIAGLGSYGSMSMSFSSDIDLIIVADDVKTHPNIQNDFQDFLAKAREILKPFEIDFKLRPEGNKSPLVWGIKNYEEYLQKRARVWEFQSLFKLNYVYGDKKLFTDFQEIIFSCVDRLNPQKIREDILQMYSSIQKQTVRVAGTGFNIKKDRGGLLTIDFILQAVCLGNQKIYKKCLGANLYKLFFLLKAKMANADLVTLKNNFQFLKQTELAVQNIFNSSKTNMPSSSLEYSIVAFFLKMKNTKELEKKITHTIKTNNTLYEKYVGK